MHAHDQQRVPADVEEVVVDRDAGATEGLLPDLEHVGLEVVGRSRGRGVGTASTEHLCQRGQGVAVDLAVRGVRQVVEHQHVGRDHDVGQRGAQVVLERRGLERDRLRGRHVGHELLVAGGVLAHDGDAFAHTGGTPELGLDLAELDPVAADLHLVVDATEELELCRPVGQLTPPGQVAGQVHAVAGDERVLDEALGGQLGTGVVAAHDAVAADPELSGDTRGHRLTVAVEHVDLRVRDRGADRDDVERTLQLPGARPDRGLGRAVHVRDVAAARRGAQVLGQRDREGLATDEQVLDLTERLT